MYIHKGSFVLHVVHADVTHIKRARVRVREIWLCFRADFTAAPPLPDAPLLTFTSIIHRGFTLGPQAPPPAQAPPPGPPRQAGSQVCLPVGPAGVVRQVGEAVLVSKGLLSARTHADTTDTNTNINIYV